MPLGRSQTTRSSWEECGHNQSVEAPGRATERLAVLEVLLAAAERRHEVVEAGWNSANDDEVSLRLRDLVEIPDGLSAQPIRDQQIRLFTSRSRMS